jgi:uncharacterized protein YukE
MKDLLMQLEHLIETLGGFEGQVYEDAQNQINKLIQTLKDILEV